MHDVIEERPLGALVVAAPDGLIANHLPFELDRSSGEFGTLRCHVSRNNEVWRRAYAECLVIFQGPSAYISPNLYPSKKEHGKVVPTYNYAVVHAHGRLTIHDDVKWLRGLVGRLTKRFEASQPEPWKITDAPQDYIEDELKGIVGLEIEISRLEGKWKMSQNRPEIDKVRLAEVLQSSAKQDEREVGRMVAENGSSRAPAEKNTETPKPRDTETQRHRDHGGS
jgi:transcriptional regulator